MSEAKFTPGPWIASGWDVVTDDSRVEGIATTVRIPDAHLIAAAPTQNEALEKVERWALSPDSRMETFPLAEVSAALAKARGE